MVIGSFWDLCAWIEQHLASFDLSTGRYELAHELGLRLLCWQCRQWGEDWGDYLTRLPWERMIRESEYQINLRNRLYFENHYQ